MKKKKKIMYLHAILFLQRAVLLPGTISSNQPVFLELVSRQVYTLVFILG